MTGPNNRRVPGNAPLSQLIQLRGDGYTVKEAAKASGMSERQAYRLLSKHAPGSETFERWSPSEAVGDRPEKVEYLFDTLHFGQWSREEAEIAWPIHCAREDLEPEFVQAFCRLYIAAKSFPGAIATRRRLIIDWAFECSPWAGEQELDRFIQGVPVLDLDEMTYAAEIARYLDHYVPSEDQFDQKARVTLQTSIGVNRREFFDSELKRLSLEEQKNISATPKGFLAVIETPGRERKRGRPRKKSSVKRGGR